MPPTPPENPAETPKQVAIQTIIEECLDHIDSCETGVDTSSTIGDGWEKNEKHYHNRRHTDFVIQEINRLFQEERKRDGSLLVDSDEDLCRLLAGTHDYDQQENSSPSTYTGGNEKRSAAWLVPEMQKSEKFDNTEIEIAKIALLGTWTPVVGGGTEVHLQQVARDLGTGDGPQSTLEAKIADLASTYGITIDSVIFRNPRAIVIAQLLADADLATLGNTWAIYWENMILFFREQHPEIKNQDNTPDNQKTWKNYLKFQVNLLNNHQYHTQAAKNRYQNCVTNSDEVSNILAPGNEALFNDSFEAMLARNGAYKPTPKAMGVIEST